MSLNLKARSYAITDGPIRAGARAMLKAAGYNDADLAKPIIGLANTWVETTPCNLISDGVTMGTEGMRASLVSREVIADSIELMGRGYLFDGMVALVGCDKTRVHLSNCEHICSG